MKNIKFSTGTLTKVGSEYYTLQLFNAEGKKIYAATLDRLTAAQMMDKHDNIKMSEFSINNPSGLILGDIVEFKENANNEKFRVYNIYFDINLAKYKVDIEMICDYKLKPTQSTFSDKLIAL